MRLKVKAFLLKRKVKVLLISIVITAVFVIAIFNLGAGGLTDATMNPFNENTNPCFMMTSINAKGSSYFYTDANISISITNPYYKWIENFTIYASTNNSTWIQIPFSNKQSFINLGSVSLNSYNYYVYLKVYYQPQDIVVSNQTIPFGNVITSFHNEIKFSPDVTPQLYVIFILLIIVVFSFILQMVDFLFRKDEIEKKHRKHVKFLHR